MTSGKAILERGMIVEEERFNKLVECKLVVTYNDGKTRALWGMLRNKHSVNKKPCACTFGNVTKCIKLSCEING